MLVGEIMMILIAGTKVKFLLKKKRAINTFCGFYQIQGRAEEPDVFDVVMLGDLQDYYPLPAYVVQGQLCLTLKHSSPCMD